SDSDEYLLVSVTQVRANAVPPAFPSFPTRRSSDLGRARLAEGDVGADRVAEQIDVLADIGRLLAQTAARDLRDRLAVDQNVARGDRKSTRLNSSHVKISYAVFCLKKKNNIN